ncbi:cyclic-di-AMP receptor [uncultured Ruminococcus sp.]|uniref:cyclic-di-AMP receptor n=1 Tax=uncultured Ruminococcus sp. TaxID=165186 RepID=UPI0025EA83AC|nr:cyclic-di-AMP receptor [uncultured Ruminococcus sp.]
MKLVYAVVNNDDTYAVNKGLQKAGIRATKLSSTGGFLMAGNTTFMICCEDAQVDTVIEVLKEHSRKRKQFVPSSVISEPHGDQSVPVEVAIGGATIFVTDIERFEQV